MSLSPPANNINSYNFRVLTIAVVFCYCLHSALGQTSDVTSSIVGTIQHSSGAGVKDATVKSTGADTGFVRTVQTAEDGSFNVPLPPIGQNSLSVTAGSFHSYRQTGIDVRLGYASSVKIVLQPGSTAELVTVNADASVLNTQTYGVSDVLDQRSVENMPA